MSERLCGPDCLTPDMAHRNPEPDWIGDYPVMHGESDHEVPDSRHFNGLYTEGPEAYCLCGHPMYQSCPGWYGGGGIGEMIIERGPAGTEQTP
ncbi:MAG: hypothetical protein JWO11_3534 [Nocardioides sp.]|nr:hypothetical protein [Nocardioides sp.]